MAGRSACLAFAAISFNLDLILRNKLLPGRAVETGAFCQPETSLDQMPRESVAMTAYDVVRTGERTDGPCPIMHDADPLKHAALLSAVREFAEHGAVTHMTDRHNPEVLDADCAVNRLEALQRDSRVLIEIGIDIAGDRSCIEIRDFVARFIARVPVAGREAVPWLRSRLT